MSTIRRTDRELRPSCYNAVIDGTAVGLAVLSRTGPRLPVVFLHGFGSSKEDFVEGAHVHALSGRGIIAFDAPGCGATNCDDLSHVSIPFLRDAAIRLIAGSGVDQYHLVGHSMGGLAGLLLALEQPHAVLSFTNIEGNLAPEDCFLSRQINQFPAADAQAFFDAFVERARQEPALAAVGYADALRRSVKPAAVAPLFHSLVDLSDRADLLRAFMGLRCRTMFMYGDQNRSLSYLRALQESGIQLVEIPSCGHFPMYSNPTAMWDAIAQFIEDPHDV